MRDKGKERLSTNNEQCEDGKKSWSQFCTETGDDVLKIRM